MSDDTGDPGSRPFRPAPPRADEPPTGLEPAGGLTLPEEDQLGPNSLPFLPLSRLGSRRKAGTRAAPAPAAPPASPAPAAPPAPASPAPPAPASTAPAAPPAPDAGAHPAGPRARLERPAPPVFRVDLAQVPAPRPRARSPRLALVLLGAAALLAAYFALR